MSWPVGPALDLNPCPDSSGLSVRQEALVQHPGTDTSSFDPYWGVEEQAVSAHVPLMTGIVPAQNPEIHASTGNPVSYAQADGNRNMSSVLAGPLDWEP